MFCLPKTYICCYCSIMFSKRTPTLFSSAVLFLGISLAVSSCFPEPDFAGDPNPRLTGFDDLYYKELGAFDSLIVRVNFQDGDGDFGTPEEQKSLLYIPVLNSDGTFQYFDPNDPNQPPFNCTNYATLSQIFPNDTTNDTIRANYNENYYNFTVTLYSKTGNEPNFEEVDFVEECGTRLGGIFFPLKDEEDRQNGKPLEGVLEYANGAIENFGRFRNDSLKIAVQIRDEAGNLSNILESPTFTLREITIESEE